MVAMETGGHLPPAFLFGYNKSKRGKAGERRQRDVEKGLERVTPCREVLRIHLAPAASHFQPPSSYPALSRWCFPHIQICWGMVSSATEFGLAFKNLGVVSCQLCDMTEALDQNLSNLYSAGVDFGLPGESRHGLKWADLLSQLSEGCLSNLPFIFV